MKAKTIKHRAIYFGILLSNIFVLISLAHQDYFPVLKGPYLGQKPPGWQLKSLPRELSLQKILGRLVVHSPKMEVFSCLIEEHLLNHIKQSIILNGKKGVWTRPAPVPFNSKFGDWCFNFGLDGRTLYFSSKRPVSGGSDHTHNIWMTQLTWIIHKICRHLM